MRLKSFVAAVVSTFAVAATAQSVVLGPLALDPNVTNQSVEFSVPAKTVLGFFTDIITFAFVPPPNDPGFQSEAVGTAVHIKLLNTPDIDFTSVLLNGVPGTVTEVVGVGTDVSTFFTPAVSFDPSNNPAYTLTISGIAAVGGTYGGSLNVAAVPEPETYLMMLAGLSAIGFLVARRRNRV